MKQSYFLSLILIVVFGSAAIGQSLESKYAFENGLYKTFEDLKDNKVVTQLPYRQDTKSSKDGVTRYSLMHEGKYKAIKGIFCFVNADHIYLNANNYGRKGYYIRSHFVGKYAYFEDRLGKEKFAVSRTPTGITSSTGAAVTSKIWGILLDMETGKVVKTSRWRMKRLLENHPRLWQKYKDGNKSTQEVHDIIGELNKSYSAGR